MLKLFIEVQNIIINPIANFLCLYMGILNIIKVIIQTNSISNILKSNPFNLKIKKVFFN